MLPLGRGLIVWSSEVDRLWTGRQGVGQVVTEWSVEKSPVS